MSKFTLTCKACGSQTTTCETGDVAQVSVEHEDDCPFLAAVEAGTAPEWVASNGYPIEPVEEPK